MESLIDRAARTEVNLLEVDPDLAMVLSEEEARAAAQRARARVELLDDGAFRAPAERWDPGQTIGLLVLDGLLTRTLSIADRTSTELLGSGDLLRPWQRDEEGMLPLHAEWRVLEPSRAAVLDRDFAVRIAPWPQLWSALVGRAMRRTRSQAVATALSHMTRVDQRLLLLLWHFAERWGRVRADGVVVTLPLTHETIGALVGARRPSVTSALSLLSAQGLVRRAERGEWILTAAARERIEQLAERD
jgi:CRP-like cAMP-binding protein